MYSARTSALSTTQRPRAAARERATEAGVGARVVRAYTAGTISTNMDSRTRPDMVDWLADGLGFIMDAWMDPGPCTGRHAVNN